MAQPRKKPDDLQDAGGGKTKVEQGGDSSPRLPHERDESSDSQQDQGRDQFDMGKRAHNDVERGVVDTDRGPVIDRLYRRKVKR